MTGGERRRRRRRRRRDLRNYGRWKTGDLPGDRHLHPRHHHHRHHQQVYGIALHAWLARRSKETNRFTFVPVATNVARYNLPR